MEEMPCDEFDDWLAYFELEPWGPVQATLHAGVLASYFWNANCGKGHEKSPADIFPSLKVDKEPEPPPVEVLVAKCDMVMAMWGGRKGQA